MSKFARVVPFVMKISRKIRTGKNLQVSRPKGYFIPPTQYDMVPSKKFRLFHVMKTNYELIPLFLVTLVPFICLGVYVYWRVGHMVDVVFWGDRRNGRISRTMDLRHPYSNKFYTINETYEPWEEMACVLEMMADAEEKLRASNVCDDDE